MDVVWPSLFGLLLAGYFALEGFDIGVGLLLPVLARTPERRDRLIAAVGPFLLANEIWLVALAGVFVGVFPVLEGEVLSGLYPAFVALLLSWVVRDAGFWFRLREKSPAWRRTWEAAVVAGSAGLTLSWGFILSGAIGGGLLTGVAYGAALAALFAAHGTGFAARRLPAPGGGPDPLAGAVARRAALPAVLLTAVAAVPVVLAHPGAWPAAVLAVAAALLATRSFPATALAAAAPALATFGALLPYLLAHTASASTLGAMSLVALPLLPFMAAAQWWVWRAFRTPVARSFF
ncbi:cytochrome d ubiquinol oxidase subunit II [Bailinhaonella thermotolerans]|uniref:Cytochrome d ubiquinol oxidase subunit II n=1 Tax=Bailinhaonella thermotolerans TaxID=1070861 RepID=A0A3A4B2Q3_9ACTN|nr:cytochrome d ubiquinol oxidase subunit II [Bailinhaonella thermotolerans]RJL31670.1 cytochrome d ubiquinol oxidase subunit II [Bailinhaonella thermotolerans]